MAENDRGLLPYLIGLLVVVLVGGGAWFFIFMPSGPGPQDIDAVCQQKCWNWKNASGIKAQAAAVDYCTSAYNLGGEVRTLQRRGTAYCSDGVHCFNRYSCSGPETTLDASTCRDILFNYYQEVNGESRQTAAQHVVDIYTPANNETGVGTCNLEADWYTQNFATTENILGQ